MTHSWLAPGEQQPPTVTDEDLDRARRLAEQFNRAVGSSHAQREFGRAWTRAAGVSTNVNVLISQAGQDGALFQRPWRWLAAVAAEALSRGDMLLVARLAVITSIWTTQVDPSGDPNIFEGVAVGRIGPAIRAQVMTPAIYALSVMSPEREVAGNQTGTVRAGDVLLLCAHDLLSIERAARSDAVAVARRVVGGDGATATGSPVRTASSARLIELSDEEFARIGQLAFGGDVPHPQGFRYRDYDRYAIKAVRAAGHRQPGTPVLDALQSHFFGWIAEDLGEAIVQATSWGHFGDRVLPDLTRVRLRFYAEAGQISESASPWAVVGLFCLAANLATDDGSRADASFTQLTLAALDVLRRDGMSFTAAPPFAIGMWTRVHGYDGALPRGWASALTNVPVPPIGQEPPTAPLAPGESRALSTDSSGQRTTFAECRSDGRVVALIEGVPAGEEAHQRWEFGVEAGTYTDFLRQLGERVVTPQLWTHDDLLPYIPCRPRSRADMRAEVACLPPLG